MATSAKGRLDWPILICCIGIVLTIFVPWAIRGDGKSLYGEWYMYLPYYPETLWSWNVLEYGAIGFGSAMIAIWSTGIVIAATAGTEKRLRYSIGVTASGISLLILEYWVFRFWRDLKYLYPVPGAGCHTNTAEIPDFHREFILGLISLLCIIGLFVFTYARSRIRSYMKKAKPFWLPQIVLGLFVVGTTVYSMYKMGINIMPRIQEAAVSKPLSPGQQGYIWGIIAIKVLFLASGVIAVIDGIFLNREKRGISGLSAALLAVVVLLVYAGLVLLPLVAANAVEGMLTMAVTGWIVLSVPVLFALCLGKLLVVVVTRMREDLVSLQDSIVTSQADLC